MAGFFMRRLMPGASFLRSKFLYALLIVLTGSLIYVNSLKTPFIYDDKGLIVRNPSVHHLSDFKTIVDYNPRRWVGNWSFAFNYTLGGLDPVGYHVVNILIHILCGLAVWYFCRLILSCPDKEILSFWIALLFITHPVQTMATDHISQRYVGLGALFYLLSLCLYFKGRLAHPGRRAVFFGASFLAGFLGIFSRETVMTLPIAIILCELQILGGFKNMKIARKSWLLALPFIFIAGIVLIFYRSIFVYFLTSKIYSQSHQGETFTSVTYFLTQFKVILVYIRVMFWPGELNFDYDMRIAHHFWEPNVLLGILFVIFLIGYAMRVRSKYPLVTFGIFWFFITQSVESTIIPIGYVMTEYRLYLPLFGVCLCFVTVMNSLIKDRRAFTIVMGAIILVFSLLTIERNKVYRDEIILWTDTLQKSPYKSRVYANLGASYCRRGEYAKGLIFLQKAVDLDSKAPIALANLAQVYTLMGNFDKARAIDEAILHQHPAWPPHWPLAYNNLGMIDLAQGHLDKARENFQKAISINDSYKEAYFNLAQVYLHKGQLEVAQKIYAKVVSQSPDDPQALVNLGSLFAARGHLDLAMDSFSKAVKAEYTYPGAYIEMGRLLYHQHRWDDAVHVWQLGLKYTNDTKTFEDLIFLAQKEKSDGK